MPRGYSDTITCPECKDGGMAEWSFCPFCGADYRHKPPKRKDKVVVTNEGAKISFESAGDFVEIQMVSFDGDTMMFEFNKGKVISAVNRLS